MLILSLLFALLIPAAAIAGLGSLATVLSSDVAYPPLLGELVAFIAELLSIGCIFAHSGVIARAFVARSHERTVAAIGLCAPILLYFCSARVDLAFRGSGVFTSADIVALALNCTFEILRCLAVILVCRRIARSERPRELELFSVSGAYSRAAVFASGVIVAAMLLSSAVETVTLLAGVGAPTNMTELLYLVRPYPAAIVYGLLGYFVVYIILRRFIKGEQK